MVMKHRSLLGPERHPTHFSCKAKNTGQSCREKRPLLEAGTPADDRKWTREPYSHTRRLRRKQVIWICERWEKRTFEHPEVKRKQGRTEWRVRKGGKTRERDAWNRREHCKATLISGRWQHFTTSRPESAATLLWAKLWVQSNTLALWQRPATPQNASYSPMQNMGEGKKSRRDEKEMFLQIKGFVYSSFAHISAKL